MTTQILLDTTYTPDYDDYVENCEINECEPQGENSQDYWNFVYRERELECDDFFDNIKYCKIDNEYYWVVSGSIGRWNGTFVIEQTIMSTLSKAIRECWNGCDDIIVKKRGSVIYVTAIHHDGRNYFGIRALSDKGRDRLERNGYISLTNRENIVTLPEYLF